MLLEPDERVISVAQQRAEIERVLAAPNSTVLVAQIGRELAGYVGAYGGNYRREHRTAYIVAGVLQAFAGRGLGTRLFAELERWARSHALHRLELTVMTHNHAGFRLYTRMGFELEGTRRGALLVDGRYVDEHYMGKILDEPV